MKNKILSLFILFIMLFSLVLPIGEFFGFIRIPNNNILSLIFASIGLILMPLFCVFYLFYNEKDKYKRIGWLLGIFLGQILVLPIFWYYYMRPIKNDQ